MEFTDRYKALGIPYPDVETMCLGQCEGTGWFPENDQTSELWIAAHNAEPHECDGWHFVKCPDCNGTGKKS
jgi:heterodisulfide reductase subunit B